MKIWILTVLGICISTVSFAAVGLQPGVKAPSFEVIPINGERVQFEELWQEGPVVLILYRGSWCPYCVKQLQEYNERYDEILEAGADLVAVSVDKQSTAEDMVLEHSFDFYVVPNPAANVITAYEARFNVPEELGQKYLNEYNLDLKAASGRDDYLLAQPATYIVGTDGIIKWMHTDEDYKVRPSVDEVLEELGKFK